jgi:hypothetical protein
MHSPPNGKVTDGSNDTFNTPEESASDGFQATTANLLALCKVTADKYAMLAADTLEVIEATERNKGTWLGNWLRRNIWVL